MNGTWPLIATTAADFSRSYLDAFTDLYLHPERFGSFASAQAASLYELRRNLTLFVPLLVVYFLACLDVFYVGQGGHAFRKGLRFFEAVFINIIFGIADATYTFLAPGAEMNENLTGWYWLTINLLFITNGIAFIVVYGVSKWKSNIQMLLDTIDTNFILVGVVLLLQFDSSYNSALLRMLAGLLFILSCQFSRTSQYLDYFSGGETTGKQTPNLSARGSTSTLYLFRAAAALLMCLTTTDQPVNLLVKNVSATPYKIIVIIIWALLSLEILIMIVHVGVEAVKHNLPARNGRGSYSGLD